MIINCVINTERADDERMWMPFVCPHSILHLLLLLCCVFFLSFRCPFSVRLHFKPRNQESISRFTHFVPSTNDNHTLVELNERKKQAALKQKHTHIRIGRPELCSAKNHGLIGWGVFCNFKLPHICYQQCELVSERVLSYLSPNFLCLLGSSNLRDIRIHAKSEASKRKKGARSKNNIYWLMRIYNFNELVLSAISVYFFCCPISFANLCVHWSFL